MRFTPFAVTLSLAAVAFGNPLRRGSSEQPLKAVLATIDVAQKDVANYKSAVESFPLAGTNEEKLAALTAISTASKQLSSDFNDQALWKILRTDFKFSHQNKQTIADALNAKLNPVFPDTEAKLQSLQPAVKELGCNNLGSAFTDAKSLDDAWRNTLTQIAIYRADSNDGEVYSGPLIDAYMAIHVPLGDTTKTFNSTSCQ